MATTVNTYCQICLTNCGIEIVVDEASNRVLSIAPDRPPSRWPPGNSRIIHAAG